MAELLGAVQDTPLPNLLVAAGIVFVFLAVVGELTDKVKVPRERQWLMGGIGVVLLILGIGLNLVNPSTTSDDQTAEVTAGQVTPPTRSPPRLHRCRVLRSSRRTCWPTAFPGFR